MCFPSYYLYKILPKTLIHTHTTRSFLAGFYGSVPHQTLLISITVRLCICLLVCVCAFMHLCMQGEGTSASTADSAKTFRHK